MPDIAYDLRYLRYALLAAEHGSFRRAAETLAVSQSTVSRRIQILERRIGLPLFERHRSGARPTDAGECFLREAIVGAMHLHQAVDAVARAKRGSTGVLRIGLMASLANGFLADLLTAFHRRFPAIEMIFEEATSHVNASALLQGRLDAAFMPGEPRLPGCQAEKLWDEKIYVAVPLAHRTACLETVAMAEVRSETFLVMADATGPETEDYLVQQLSGPDFYPKISVQHIGCENLLNMVSQGFGITLATASTINIAHLGVRFVPIVGDEDAVSFSIVWSHSNRNPALKYLVDMSLDRRTKARGSGESYPADGLDVTILT